MHTNKNTHTHTNKNTHTHTNKNTHTHTHTHTYTHIHTHTYTHTYTHDEHTNKQINKRSISPLRFMINVFELKILLPCLIWTFFRIDIISEHRKSC